jgi:hypothetical protein
MLEAGPEPGLYSAALERDEAMSGLVDETPVGTAPSHRERSQIRRRVRYLRKLRELQLRDLGGFLLEQARVGRENPEIVEAKLAGAVETDRELRQLERALDRRTSLRELREPGVGGACPSCGTVHGSSDRYCSRCGQKL